MKKMAIVFGVLLLLFSGCYLLREKVFRSMAHFLIQQDELQSTAAMAVLSGGGWDRGNEAGRIFKKGLVKQVICTGGNPLPDLKAYGLDVTESDVTKQNLLRNAVPDSAIIQIKKGSSTMEEKQLLLKYCSEHGIKKLLLLSSLYHTRRIRSVFEEEFRKAGITLIIRGSRSSRFDEYRWWESEDGLIAMNNEMMKTIYYLLKY